MAGDDDDASNLEFDQAEINRKMERQRSKPSRYQLEREAELAKQKRHKEKADEYLVDFQKHYAEGSDDDSDPLPSKPRTPTGPRGPPRFGELRHHSNKGPSPEDLDKLIFPRKPKMTLYNDDLERDPLSGNDRGRKAPKLGSDDRQEVVSFKLPADSRVMNFLDLLKQITNGYIFKISTKKSHRNLCHVTIKVLFPASNDKANLREFVKAIQGQYAGKGYTIASSGPVYRGFRDRRPTWESYYHVLNNDQLEDETLVEKSSLAKAQRERIKELHRLPFGAVVTPSAPQRIEPSLAYGPPTGSGNPQLRQSDNYNVPSFDPYDRGFRDGHLFGLRKGRYDALRVQKASVRSSDKPQPRKTISPGALWVERSQYDAGFEQGTQHGYGEGRRNTLKQLPIRDLDDPVVEFDDFYVRGRWGNIIEPDYQIEIEPPKSDAVRQYMSLAISGICKNGSVFEEALMGIRSIQIDPDWSFLWNSCSAEGVFYRWLLWTILSGITLHTFKMTGKYGLEIWREIFKSNHAAPFLEPEDQDLGSYSMNRAHMRETGRRVEDSHDESRRLRILDTAESKYQRYDAVRFMRFLHDLPLSKNDLKATHIAQITLMAIDSADLAMEDICDLLMANLLHPFNLFESDHSVPAEGKSVMDAISFQLQKTFKVVDPLGSYLVALFAVTDLVEKTKKDESMPYQGMFEVMFEGMNLFGILGRLPKDLDITGVLRLDRWKGDINNLLYYWDSYRVFKAATVKAFKHAFENPPLDEEERAAQAVENAAREARHKRVRDEEEDENAEVPQKKQKMASAALEQRLAKQSHEDEELEDEDDNEAENEIENEVVDDAEDSDIDYDALIDSDVDGDPMTDESDLEVLRQCPSPDRSRGRKRARMAGGEEDLDTSTAEEEERAEGGDEE